LTGDAKNRLLSAAGFVATTAMAPPLAYSAPYVGELQAVDEAIARIKQILSE
jgi:hypothetical protein